MSKFVDSLLLEGVFDPGILKAVFMGGGPGSGKTTIASVLFDVPNESDMRWASFSASGLKLVNPDRAFIMGLIKAGYDPAKLASIPDEEVERIIGGDHPGPNTIRGKAKAASAHAYELHKDSRLGMLIDGTAGNFPKISMQHDELENLGYDTSLVFVNTTLAVAMARNKARSRVVKDEVVIGTWHECQDNLQKLRGLFSPRFEIVENNEATEPGKLPSGVTSAIASRIQRFVSQPLQNPKGIAWKAGMEKIRQRM